MGMAVSKPNAGDQKLQAVLYLMDKLDSKYGIDGQKGDLTVIAMQRASTAMGMGTMGSSEDARKVQQALTDKLKDPQFRQNALEKLKQIDPPTKDSIIAMQVVLGAAGHNVPRDIVTGMVTGKMDATTRFALENTENGKPNATAFAAVGINQATYLALNQRSDSQFGNTFASAAVGPSATEPQSPAVVRDRKVALASSNEM